MTIYRILNEKTICGHAYAVSWETRKRRSLSITLTAFTSSGVSLYLPGATTWYVALTALCELP